MLLVRAGRRDGKTGGERTDHLDEAGRARAAVLASDIGYVMEPDALDDIARGCLVRLLEDWTPPLGALCLYYPGPRHQSAAMKAFIALARDHAGKQAT